jgi:hypothetical protein
LVTCIRPSPDYRYSIGISHCVPVHTGIVNISKCEYSLVLFRGSDQAARQHCACECGRSRSTHRLKDMIPGQVHEHSIFGFLSISLFSLSPHPARAHAPSKKVARVGTMFEPGPGRVNVSLDFIHSLRDKGRQPILLGTVFSPCCSSRIHIKVFRRIHIKVYHSPFPGPRKSHALNQTFTFTWIYPRIQAGPRAQHQDTARGHATAKICIIGRRACTTCVYYYKKRFSADVCRQITFIALPHWRHSAGVGRRCRCWAETFWETFWETVQRRRGRQQSLQSQMRAQAGRSPGRVSPRCHLSGCLGLPRALPSFLTRACAWVALDLEAAGAGE